MWKRILIGMIGGILIYVLFWPKKEVVVPPPPPPPSSPLKVEDEVVGDAGARNDLPPTSTQRPLPQEPPQDSASEVDAEETFPSVDEFEKKIRARDLREWLKESKKVNGSYLADESGLNQLHESGVIRAGEKEIQYRYEAIVSDATGGVADACSSLLPPDEPLKIGSLGEGTLTIWKGPIEAMQIMEIGKKDYFVRYFDRTPSRGKDGSGEPTAPITTGKILYYQRQADDKITYQGKLEKYTSADPNFKLKGHDYCRYSFGEFDHE